MNDLNSLYCWVKLCPKPEGGAGIVAGSKGTDPHSTPINTGVVAEVEIATGLRLKAGVGDGYAGTDPQAGWVTVSQLFVGRAAADDALFNTTAGAAWRADASVFFPVEIGLLLNRSWSAGDLSVYAWFKRGQPPVSRVDPILDEPTAVLTAGISIWPFGAIDASGDANRQWTASQPLLEGCAVDPIEDQKPQPCKVPARVTDWYDSTQATDRFLLRLYLTT